MENTITSKRKAYCAVEKAALIAAYKASGLSKKEWCQENAIGLSTLQRWLQHEKSRTSRNRYKTGFLSSRLRQNDQPASKYKSANAKLP
ncbi:hypothetical protein SCACP_27010 [Sporomusa carbonis]